jgi:hypothetical protein
MSDQSNASQSRRILVAGDVCLDVIGVPIPPKSSGPTGENWRITGERRTHFLPGGAMLLAKFVRAPRMAKALQEAEEEARKEIKKSKRKMKPDEVKECRWALRDKKRREITQSAEDEVIGPRPLRPEGIADGVEKPLSSPLYQDDFINIAERLRRDEIVHSLMGVTLFATTNKKDDKTTVLRVEKEYGYSGPINSEHEPSLKIEYPVSETPPEIIVLDDTGNRFRKGARRDSEDDCNPWPAAIPPEEEAAVVEEVKPLIVYKLHRPLPSHGSEKNGPLPQSSETVPVHSSRAEPNRLWSAVRKHHPDNRIVIVSIDDLRQAGAPISGGLSWERTALDVVWHLLHFEHFSELRDCPRLVVRLGLDGAILWQASKTDGELRHRAWLVYDPKCIEGSFALDIPGTMVSCGSAFTAALVHCLAKPEEDGFSELLKPVDNRQDREAGEPEQLLLKAIKAGLQASRQLLLLGFGDYLAQPNYPGPELFKDDGTGSFFSHPIPIFRHAGEPDRAFWRLLDSIFVGQREHLARVVNLTATKRKEGAADEEIKALELLKAVPLACYGALQTHDRGEIENYRALHTLLRDYLCARATQRPLSIGVFGPPGAGKSFGVKEVAASLKGQRDCKEIEPLTFNLSLYQTPEELSAAFHLVRDISLRGKAPLVFFDEFDTSLGGKPLGWLRYFLAPMQDGEFLDRGAPHPIGQAIFIFAGGTSAYYDEFKRHPGLTDPEFKSCKGPDFLSRLRATLDIPSLNFLTPCEPIKENGKRIQPSDTFDPYGPIEAFPCEAAILLRRASILAFNLPKKASSVVRADGSMDIAPEVLRALLRLPQFVHGNRSFEALLDMSHLVDTSAFTPALLPAPFQVPLHANAEHIAQLVSTEFPFPAKELERIAEQIHEAYLKERSGNNKINKEEPSHQPWSDLSEFYRQRNRVSAESIPDKLRSIGLWFRKVSGKPSATFPINEEERDGLIERLAQAEHDRWVADQRRQGYAHGSVKDPVALTHPDIKRWSELSDEKKNQDRDAVRRIPTALAAAGYEVTTV